MDINKLTKGELLYIFNKYYKNKIFGYGETLR